MQVSIAEAGSRLPESIQAAKGGDQVVITQDGEPIAEIKPAPPRTVERRKPEFDTMKGKIRLKPGWDDPMTEEQFFSGDF
jgi:antitoxin (DNA-binding transcriptional repressor) of toxin-antitoxin stability system